MIVNTFNCAKIIYQEADEDDGLPNESIVVHVDNGGTLLLTQADREIVLNRNTLADIVKAAKAALAAYDKTQKR